MHPPHPYLKLRTYPGRFEVWLDGLARPIARGAIQAAGSGMPARDAVIG